MGVLTIVCPFRGSRDEIFVSFQVNTMTEWFLLSFSHDRNHPLNLPGFYLVVADWYRSSLIITTSGTWVNRTAYIFRICGLHFV